MTPLNSYIDAPRIRVPSIIFINTFHELYNYIISRRCTELKPCCPIKACFLLLNACIPPLKSSSGVFRVLLILKNTLFPKGALLEILDYGWNVTEVAYIRTVEPQMSGNHILDVVVVPLNYTQMNKRAEGQWILTVRNPNHNHPPAEEIASLATARRLPAQTREIVRQLLTAGIKPAAVLSAIRQNPGILSNSVTTYIKGVTIRKRNFGGRAPIATLLDEIRHRLPTCLFSRWYTSKDKSLFFAS